MGSAAPQRPRRNFLVPERALRDRLGERPRKGGNSKFGVRSAGRSEARRMSHARIRASRNLATSPTRAPSTPTSRSSSADALRSWPTSRGQIAGARNRRRWPGCRLRHALLIWRFGADRPRRPQPSALIRGGARRAELASRRRRRPGPALGQPPTPGLRPGPGSPTACPALSHPACRSSPPGACRHKSRVRRARPGRHGCAGPAPARSARR